MRSPHPQSVLGLMGIPVDFVYAEGWICAHGAEQRMREAHARIADLGRWGHHPILPLPTGHLLRGTFQVKKPAKAFTILRGKHQALTYIPPERQNEQRQQAKAAPGRAAQEGDKPRVAALAPGQSPGHHTDNDHHQQHEENKQVGVDGS